MTLGVIGTAALVVLALSLALSVGWLVARRTAAQAELAEALERQAATSEILRVISSSPADIQPVFDTIAESASRLCSAQFCLVFRYDGALIHFVAHRGIGPAGIDALQRVWPAAPSRGRAAARAVLSGAVEQIPDVHLDPDFEISNAADIANFRSTVAVPMIRAGRAIGAIAVARSQAGLFPERQIELLKAFADQAVIAIENVRLFSEVEARNRDLNEALEQQTATSDILRVISSSPTDIQPVFDTIAESASRLCSAQFCFVFRFDGALIHFVAYHGIGPAGVEALQRVWPAAPSRGRAAARAVLSGAVEQIPDVHLDPDYELSNTADIANFRSTVAVPMLRDGRAIGAITVSRSEAGLFPERQIELLKAFADQAVIAIENVRLFSELEARNRDLNEALEQQTATSEILRVISRSPTDIQPVFDTIAESAARLCRSQVCLVSRFDGEFLHFAAHYGLTPLAAEALRAAYPMAPGRASAAARAVLSGAVEQIPNVDADPDYYTVGIAKIVNYRSTVAVPILRDGLPIGAIAVGRTELGLFPKRQIELLQTFADQAVIAIENVRLFSELEARTDDLSESLQQQTATADVLKVISRSTFDLQAVLDTLVESAVRLCEAYDSIILLRDGEYLQKGAHFGPIPFDFARWPITRSWTAGRAVVDRKPVHVPDLQTAGEEFPEGQSMALRLGHRTILSLPLLRGEEVIGTITIRRTEVRPFSDKQIDLLTTFADQAVIAIENVRLFDEVHARTRELTESLEQQTATSEILRAISMSPSNVQPVFETIVRNAVSLCGSLFANVFRFDGELVHFVASHNVGPDYVELLEAKFPMRPDSSQVAGRVLLSKSVVRLEDALVDPDYDHRFPLALGWRKMLGVPMLRKGDPLGVIVVGWAEPGLVSKRQEDLLKTFADQAVIAIENVRLFTEVQARNRELNEALQQQTATADVLKVISRSTFDLQAVLDTLTVSAARLCRADMAGITRPVGQDFYYATNHNFPPDWLAFVREVPLTRDRGSIVGRVLLDGKVAQVADVLADPEYVHSRLARKAGFRTFLGVPLLREGEPIGVLVVGRKTVELFTDKQIELLMTFADQAVIAIENVRLFDEVQTRNRELSEALEQQTATSEILRVISDSPTNIQPVFDVLAENAARLCDAQNSVVYRFDGKLIHLMAHSRLSPDVFATALRAFPMLPDRGTAGARAILSGTVEEIPNTSEDADYLHGAFGTIMNTTSALAVPMLKDGVSIGAIVVDRTQTGYFPRRQVELLRTFADQAVIAIENVRLFDEVQARTRDLSEALQQQTATAEVLQVISRSAFDLDTVLTTLVQTAIQLCDATRGFIWLRKGEQLFLAAHLGYSEEFVASAQNNPITPSADAMTLSGLAAFTGEIVNVEDVLNDPRFRSLDARKSDDSHAGLAVPLKREGRVEGVIALSRPEARLFTARQCELVQTFADQAVIAIENVRLFDEVQARNREVGEALQQQTATADVLKVISRSAFDLQSVLDTLVESSIRLCGANDAAILLKEGDSLQFKAHQGPIPVDFEGWPISRSWVSGRAVVDGKPVHVHDLGADDEYPDGREMARRMGFRTIVAVPLLRGQEGIGALMIRRLELNPFTDKQINLLATFADQAVIAIENVRLFDEVQARTGELTEALEQQTATSEVLRVISSSPGELEPVFQAMLANATRICEANLGTMYYYQDGAFHLAAWLGASPALAELYSQRGSFRPQAGTPLDRLLRTKDVIHIADDAAELNPGAAARLGGARSTIAVPMLKDDELVGAIVIYRQEVRPFTHKQIELVTSFANQAVIAIENVRLLKELRERTTELAQSVEELGALGEVSRAVNSTLDLETVLNTIVAKAVQLSGTDAGSIYVLNKAHTKFRLRATYGMDEAMVAAIRDRRIRPGETAIGRATEQRQPVQIPDLLNAPSGSVLDVVVQAGFRAILIVPLLGPEHAIGVLVIRRKVAGEFPQTTIDLLQTFASQSVVAILNARLFREIEEKSQQLEVASRHKSQFLANMSHELRTPLNAILGYSELILDDIYGQVPDKARAALERVQSNGKHLLGLINDVLDLAKIEAGRLSLSLAEYSIDEVVASVAAAVEGMAAEKQLALKLDVPPGLPVAQGDEQRIRQVLLNLVSNAIKFTDIGEVAIKACLSNGALRVSVSDTGPGISAEDQAKLFQDFQQADNSSTRKKGGTGLGLAISKRFIDLHGGRIWVQSVPGQGSTFSFELPVTMEHQEEVA